jgi:hypothetical protein
MAQRMVRGAAGGLAGALVLQGLRMASERMAPQTMPTMSDEPDKFLVAKAERHLPTSIGYRIPEAVDTIAARSLALSYGAISGTLAAMVGAHRGSRLIRSIVLGLATWAVGYLGWLPKAKLMRPVWKQHPVQIAGPIVRHLAFGFVTVAVSNWLARKSRF